MGKKKSYIDKSKSVTFRLTPAVDEKPQIIGNPELVNVVPVTDEELAEREKYGVYFADNYNYMSHLKSKEEVPAYHLIAKDTLNAPETSQPKVASNVIEIKGREIPLYFPASTEKPSVSQIDGVDELDPEILEMLNEEAEDGFDNGGDLEDDFMELAGGVDMPEGRRIFDEIRQTAGADLSGSDIDSDEDALSDIPDEEMADEGELDDKPRSILKNAHPTVVNKKELDERFNQFYENMDSDQEDEEADDEEEEIVDEALLENFAGDYQDEKDRGFFEKPDVLSKDLTLKAYEAQEAGRPEQTEQIEVKSKRAKWDCESITSTYSNIYNHPTIIREPSKRKKPSSKKNPEEMGENGDAEMEFETASIRSIASTSRSRGETAEERKVRKQAVKEERRDQREKKKTLKEMFKEERKKRSDQRGQGRTPGRPIS
ncbi:Protein LTV1-like protein [Aphelenchoides bicaudatus]|nr:Protein LTV1-like protein [Aphelenchoides bicaudatus]